MTRIQGDVGLLNDPVAQQLLQSKVFAYLAYCWHDGTPRVVPIGFQWNGREIVLGTGPDSPKMKALHNGTRVALAIENEARTQALMIRGCIRVDTVEGVAPEYALMCRRIMGEAEGQAWVDLLGSGLAGMARIHVYPDWVGLLDENHFHQWVAEALERAQHSQ